MTTTPNPTAEQIVYDALGQCGMLLGTREHAARDAVERLRAAGLLGGDPTEERLLAALNAYQRTDHEQNGIKRPYVYAENLDDWGPQTIARMRAALAAAGVAPQEPNSCNDDGCLSDSFTPTPDEVRDRYADARAGIGEWTRFDESVKRAVEEAYEEFDRMIAAIEREAAARALDERKVAEVIEQMRDRSRKERDVAKESLGQFIARALCEAAKRGELNG
ncbi:hypothetical protein JD276_15675 [Leucobacter sp. CSA1]|uniref:Uncharacterized protein n=1 Tax=Leucobacter chromiisoli TaxID=2796471 RepID=A0A934QAC9_9MICO|nr:hypothetical protein [Leucobacter chromiisoli]MBK0420463.1 hypothetical protein [Leucobacter chromiisoli]